MLNSNSTVTNTEHNDEEKHEHGEHDHDFRNHHQHHRNEIRVAVTPVYFIKEKMSLGLHMQYMYNIPKTNFGIGYSRIFDDHEHDTVEVGGSFRSFDTLPINIAPGFTFEKVSSTGNFTVHLEGVYEWGIHNLHLGPAFEIAYDPEDIQ